MSDAKEKQVAANLRALDADVDQLPEIPQELADYIAALTPEDLARERPQCCEIMHLTKVP